MKKIKWIVTLFAAVMLSFSGCESKENKGNLSVTEKPQNETPVQQNEEHKGEDPHPTGQEQGGENDPAQSQEISPEQALKSQTESWEYALVVKFKSEFLLCVEDEQVVGCVAMNPDARVMEDKISTEDRSLREALTEIIQTACKEQYVKNGDDVKLQMIRNVMTGKTAEMTAESVASFIRDTAKAYGVTVNTELADEYRNVEYEYFVPLGYTITVNGIKLTEDYRTGIYPKELVQAAKFVDAPVNALYCISSCEILDKPEVLVSDAEGNPVAVTADDRGWITIPTVNVTGVEIPEEKYDLVLVTAQKWLDFNTNDLPGENHGFDEIGRYLTGGSALYKQAEDYSKIDSTGVAEHVAGDPKYTNLSISNYYEYGEKCFSVHVHLVKNMRLLKSDNTVTTEFDNVCVFVYCDNTDNGEDDPQWTLCDMIGVKEGTRSDSE